MLRSIVENGALYFTLTGLALATVGWAWLVVTAFRRHIAWGLGLLFFPPTVLAFVPLNWGRARWPAGLIALGLLVASIPPAVGYLTPIDLGPRETIVEGERHITITGWDRDDYAMLGSKRDVVVLQMANPDVTDATLAHLEGLDALRELDLADSRITDAGLAVVAGLPALERLRLANTAITDAGFREHLMAHPTLRQVDLRGTGVEAETVAEWKAAGPGRRALTGPRPAIAPEATPSEVKEPVGAMP